MAGNSQPENNNMTATKTTAAEAIRELAKKHGNVTAEIVLRAASKKNSPLHSHFQWDDTRAARLYRLEQASELIRRIKVEYSISENRSVRVRAFHNVSNSPDVINSKGVFVSLDTALSVQSYRDQLLDNCKRDMSAFRQKYAALTEAAGVIAAMDLVS